MLSHPNLPLAIFSFHWNDKKKASMGVILNGVVVHPSTMGRSVLQGAPIVVGEVATLCIMHAARFFINTHLLLTFITTHLLSVQF